MSILVAFVSVLAARQLVLKLVTLMVAAPGGR